MCNNGASNNHFSVNIKVTKVLISNYQPAGFSNKRNTKSRKVLAAIEVSVVLICINSRMPLAVTVTSKIRLVDRVWHYVT